VTAVDALWSRLRANGPGWYWIGAFAHHGDLYHACSLAEAFRAEHGAHIPLRLVVSQRSQAAVASLFREQFASVIVEPHLPALRSEWQAFLQSSKLPAFGPDSPLVFFPDINVEAPSQRITGDRFLRENQITWMAWYRVIFHLPEGAEPAPPPLRADLRDHAARLCEEGGVAPGRSAILFPHAQHWPEPAALTKLAALAATLSSRGWTVFTSTVGEEAAVPGTRSLFIPFDLLIEVAERAGWAIGIRSGVWDVLSSARCRKTILHHSPLSPPVWGTDALELDRAARLLVVDFERESADRLAARIISGEALAPFVRRFRVSTDQVAAGMPTDTFSFIDLQRNATDETGVERSSPPFIGGASGGLRRTRPSSEARLTDLTRRDHPRWGALAGEAVARFVEQAGSGSRFYTCRDRPGAGADFYEEVDVPSLLAGRYHAARFWHSVVSTPGAALELVLPEEAKPQVLPLESLVIGQSIRPGVAFGGDAHRAATHLQRPFSYRGLQLIEGWSGVEPWGVWSLGTRAVLKLVLPRPWRETLVVALRATAAVSAQFPRLKVRVEVNGGEVAARTFTRDRTEAGIDLVVPREAAGSGRVLWLEFHLDEVRSPKEQGGSDERRLGIGLLELTVQSELSWRLNLGAAAFKRALRL
jgi:hypothetical protein